MRILFVVLLLVSSVTIFCDNAEPPIPETQIEEVVQDWWQNWTAVVADSSMAWQGKSIFACSDLSQFSDFRLYSYLRLNQANNTFAYYDKRNKGEANYHIYSKLQPHQKVLDELIIGNYRLRFGNSLVLGNSNRHYRKPFKIEEPGSPDRYSQSGAVLQIHVGKLSLAPYLSVQKRCVSIRDSLITQIPKLKTSQNPFVNEQTTGLLSAYTTSHQQLGLLYYNQNYTSINDEPIYNSHTEFASVYYSLYNQEQRLDSETAYNGHDLIHSSSWQIRSPRFQNQLSFVYYPSPQLLAYAANPLLLSSVTNAYEYSYAIRYKPLPPLALGLQVGAVKKLNVVTNSDWLSRSIVNMEYKQPVATTSLYLYRFDRDILTTVDSIYAETVPLHYRVRLNYQRAITRSLSFRLNTSYRFEQKTDYAKNSYYWENSFAYTGRKTSWDCGISNWQTTNQIVETNSEMGVQEEYLSLVKDDLVLFTHARFPIKGVKLSLGFRQSILDSRKGSLSVEFSL